MREARKYANESKLMLTNIEIGKGRQNIMKNVEAILGGGYSTTAEKLFTRKKLVSLPKKSLDNSMTSLDGLELFRSQTSSDSINA